MDADPFDHWYSSQLATKWVRNHNPEAWDFFTINHDEGLNSDVEENQISLEQVHNWVARQPSSKSPGFGLLLARHKNCALRSGPYPCLPFGATQFRTIFDTLFLPAQYFHLRGTAGIHCNASTCHTEKDASGNILRITLLFRIGLGFARQCGSAWSFALAWDARTSRTIGFLEGLSDAHLSELKYHIRSCSPILGHPLILPEILLHMITTQLNEGTRIPCEEEFYREEWRTGLSNLPYPSPDRYTVVWKWDFQVFQEVTARANKCLTSIVFLRRRFDFTLRLAQRLLSLLAELNVSQYEDERIKTMLKKTEHNSRQRLLNRIGLLETYEHQTECVQKRIENLNTVLYTVVSQIDSRNQGSLAKINLRIAQAIRSDSIPMRTIAYVTLVLLPGALIAAIFGMNFFQFDPLTHEVLVAKTFWYYWVVTIPVTIVVVAFWNVWNFSEKKKRVGNDKEISILDEKLHGGELHMDARLPNSRELFIN